MHCKFPVLFLSLLVLQAATKPACWKRKGRRAVKNWRAFWEASTDSFQWQGQDSLACPALGPDPLNCPSGFFFGGGVGIYQAQKFLWDCGEMPQLESWQ